jgi:hypothetical protein
MIRPLAALAGITLLTAAFAAPALLAEDFTTLPPNPAEVHAGLTAAGVALTSQIEAAQNDTGGLALTASLNHVDGTANVQVYTADKCFDVVIAKDGTVASKTEKPRFPGDPVSGDWTETSSGLKYWDMVEGDGATPPSSSTKVRVHYTGWFLNGKEFDSSVKRGQPADFPLNGVIKGWTEGVGSMKVGGKRKLIIPSDLGYGPRGRASIPGGATLVFDVELIAIL